jgi:hypothetical protein
VVLRGLGHIFNFIHEQHNPAGGIRWDKGGNSTRACPVRPTT